MAVSHTCPDNPRLQQLAGGSISHEEMEAFAQHLEECPACAERVGGLSERTGLVGQVPYAS